MNLWTTFRARTERPSEKPTFREVNVDIVIFGLTAAGLRIAIDIVLLCVYAAKNKKDKNDTEDK